MARDGNIHIFLELSPDLKNNVKELFWRRNLAFISKANM